jgi:hypothetical protein
VRSLRTLPVFSVEAGSSSSTCVSGSARQVLDAARHDQELAALEPHRAVAQRDLEHAIEHEEEVILVRVPHELARELGELHLLAVRLPDDLRAPGVAEQAELVREVHVVHVFATASRSSARPAPARAGTPRRARSRRSRTRAPRSRAPRARSRRSPRARAPGRPRVARERGHERDPGDERDARPEQGRRGQAQPLGQRRARGRFPVR